MLSVCLSICQNICQNICLCVCEMTNERVWGVFTFKHAQNCIVGSRPGQRGSRALKSPTADVRLKLLCVPTGGQILVSDQHGLRSVSSLERLLHDAKVVCSTWPRVTQSGLKCQKQFGLKLSHFLDKRRNKTSEGLMTVNLVLLHICKLICNTV